MVIFEFRASCIPLNKSVFVNLYRPCYHFFKSRAMYFLISGFTTPQPPVCEKGLGLESYAIPDSEVKASSMVDIHHRPGNGRLHFQKVPSPLRYGAWATAGAHYLTNKDSWFQVNFGSWAKVTIVATQGRQNAAQWVTKYRLSYSYDGLFFKYYMEGDYPKVLLYLLLSLF